MPVTSVRYPAGGWGVGELLVEDRRVLQHELPRPPLANVPQGAPGPPETSVPVQNARNSDGFVTNLAARLQRFFAGDTVEFGDVELELDWCTPFQRALAEALRGVPRGEVVTYGELAALAGRPGAPRAAGTFCAHNLLPVFIPCHRVIAAHGIGGYGSLGVGYKRRLLALEDVAL